MRTGKCADFGEAAATMAERRAQLAGARARARARARRDRHASVEPLAGPADHRHAALPPERRAPPLRRLAQQHLRPPRPRRDPRRRPRDRRLQRAAALPARAARALGELAVRRGGRHRPALGAHADLHADVPALRDPGRLRRLAGVRGLRRVPLPHRLDRPSTRSSGGASGPHLAYPTVEIRICDAQPDLAEAQALAALAYALAARCARALDEGEPLPDLPHRLLEENLWRAIRYGLSGELIDFDRGEPVPARARLEQLIEWVAPGRRGDRRRAVPRRARGERRRAPAARAGKMARRWSRSTPSR